MQWCFDEKLSLLFANFVDKVNFCLVDDCDALLLGDVYHLSERRFQKYAWDFCQLATSLFGKGNFGVNTACCVHNGLDVAFLCLNAHSIGCAMTATPKVFAIAVAVVYWYWWEKSWFGFVCDTTKVLFLHPNFVNLQNKVCAKLACDTVKVAVRWLVALQLAGLVEVGIFQTVVPSAFENLVTFLHHLWTVGTQLGIYQSENAILHFLLGGIARETKANGLFEVLLFVGDKVQCALFGAQDVLRCVGTVSRLQNHGVVVLASNVVRKAQRICAQVGLAVFSNGANQNGGHGEVG